MASKNEDKAGFIDLLHPHSTVITIIVPMVSIEREIMFFLQENPLEGCLPLKARILERAETCSATLNGPEQKSRLLEGAKTFLAS